MRVINVTPKMDALLLGKQGENKSTKFLFDVSGWLEDYPGCTITLVHRRPHESSSYPCVLTTEEDGRRSWVINSADLAKDGDGQAELKCTLGDVIEKDKRTWKTKIGKSLSGDGDAPEPWESLMDDIEALVGDAQDAAEDAEDAATAAATSEANAADSETAAAGSATAAAGSATEAAASAAEAAAAAEALIDDTAGEGDTDKTWSADKLHDEFNGKANKYNTVLTSTLSRGRREGSSVGKGSYAFGNSVVASGENSHAEGLMSTASGENSHAEGHGTHATNARTHAEGYSTYANGANAHSEGYATQANGPHSHAEGSNTTASHKSQHVFGEFNIADDSSASATNRGNYVEIVGNGTGPNTKSNARTLDWDGNEELAGDLTIKKGTANEVKVSELYKKPATGIPASDMADGVIPDPTALIDDTAGSGDTDKVWSADKSSSLLTQINSKQDAPSATGTAGQVLGLDSNLDPVWVDQTGGGGGGTTDYTALTNKPQINGITLTGNKAASELGLLSGQGVTEAVDEYMEENFSNPSNPPLDRSLSSALSAAPADVVGENFSVLLESGQNETILSVLTESVEKVIGSDGNINAGTLSNQKVYAFTVTGYDSLKFKFTGRTGSENKIAFYSAETLANCSSSTLIGSVESYTSASDNTVNVPSGAKTFCIGAKAMTSMKGVTSYVVAKSDASLTDVYSTSKIYYVNEYCVYSGAIYRRKIYTGIAEPSFDSTKWESTKVLTEVQKLNEQNEDYQYFDSSLFQIGYVNSDGDVATSQKYKVVNTNIMHITEVTKLVVANGYGAGIWYYDSQGTYTENSGWLETDYALTIMAGSYVRIVIQKDNVYDTLTTNDIPGYVHAVTFKTEHGKTKDTIKENSEGTMKALAAKMFQKGGSPVSFTKYPCILVAGQSNIDGRVPNEDLPSSITPPFNNIYCSINSTSGSFTNPMPMTSVKWGIDFSLYSELNKLGSRWYVIKKSMGGASISPEGDSSYHWTPFYEELDDISKSLLHTFHQQINACDHSLFDFRAMIWQQGEGDRAGTSKKAALDYYKNFRCLIAYIRGITGNEKLPVVCGTVSHNSGQYDPVVEAATLQLASEDPYMICIDMSGATLLDSYHFDADSAVYFGYKAFDALIDLGVITGTKINPVCPWEDED